MIKSFRHKGLERFFTLGDVSGIQPAHANRLKRQLDRLDAATNPNDMNLPGWRLHTHKGHGKNAPKVHSVDVNGNWRLLFEFSEEGPVNVDYADPH